MKITLIAAKSTNNVIGMNNGIPWHLPLDMKWFRNYTEGKPVVMGRKTYESLNMLHGLPKRLNFVISRNLDYRCGRCGLCEDLASAFNYVSSLNLPELVVIGGGDIYRQAWSHADKILLTEIHAVIRGDTFWPVPMGEFKEVCREKHYADKDHTEDFDFVEYVRRNY